MQPLRDGTVYALLTSKIEDPFIWSVKMPSELVIKMINAEKDGLERGEGPQSFLRLDHSNNHVRLLFAFDLLCRYSVCRVCLIDLPKGVDGWRRNTNGEMRRRADKGNFRTKLGIVV
jgi:hypothetical protein